MNTTCCPWIISSHYKHPQTISLHLYLLHIYTWSYIPTLTSAHTSTHIFTYPRHNHTQGHTQWMHKTSYTYTNHIPTLFFEVCLPTCTRDIRGPSTRQLNCMWPLLKSQIQLSVQINFSFSLIFEALGQHSQLLKNKYKASSVDIFSVGPLTYFPAGWTKSSILGECGQDQPHLPSRHSCSSIFLQEPRCRASKPLLWDQSDLTTWTLGARGSESRLFTCKANSCRTIDRNSLREPV